MPEQPLTQADLELARAAMAEPKLTHADRKQATDRLSAMAAEISQLATWLDLRGGSDQGADEVSVILERAGRDLLAAAWLVKPADHSRPEWWLNGSHAIR